MHLPIRLFHPRLLRAGAIAAGLFVLGGAGSSTVAGAQTPVIHIGTTGKDTDAEAFFAADLGFFQRAGLDVDIQVLPNGAAIAAAVAGGSLQLGNTNVLTLAKAHEHGLPFSIIALSAVYSDAKPATVFVVDPASTITTAKDLAGKIVAGVSLGGLDQLSMEAWIDQHGGDSSAEKYVEMHTSETVPALERGAIGAANLSEPEMSAFRGRYRVLGNSYGAVAKHFAQTGWFATNDWIAQNPDLVRKYQAVMVDAAAWASDPANHERASQILAKYAQSTSADAVAHYAKTNDPALVQPVIDQAVKYKLLDRRIDAAELFATAAPH